MTPQEVFDKSVGGVIAQGGPSYAQGDGCRYRLGNLKCAAGHLIADEDYKDQMEGRSSNSYAVAEVLPAGHGSLINQLQTAHDTSAAYSVEPFLGQFKSRVTQIAKNYGLSTAILETKS